MLKMVFHLEYRLIIPIVEDCSHGGEAEVFLVEEALVQGLIEVEGCHEAGSVVEVEDQLLLLKLHREVVAYWVTVT
jgi:hypothetical protein